MQTFEAIVIVGVVMIVVAIVHAALSHHEAKERD
jgi:hypothetical protein